MRADREFMIVLPENHETVEGLKALEADYIEFVLQMCKYNQSKTAIALGISRGCLRMKLKEYFSDQYL